MFYKTSVTHSGKGTLADIFLVPFIICSWAYAFFSFSGILSILILFHVVHYLFLAQIVFGFFLL